MQLLFSSYLSCGCEYTAGLPLRTVFNKNPLNDPALIVSSQVGKDKTLRVKVAKIHQLENPEGETAEKKLEAACDSPSSDKENASQENQRKEPPPPSREEENRRESLSEWRPGPAVKQVWRES